MFIFYLLNEVLATEIAVTSTGKEIKTRPLIPIRQVANSYNQEGKNVA
jgi:hypothetical protein